MSAEELLVGVLALQGAFEEHQRCLEAVGCRTVQVRTPKDLEGLDGIVLPGGESTAMGLIGTVPSGAVSSSTVDNTPQQPRRNMWVCLREFKNSKKPVWGTCAGMILLAERCVGTSAVIEGGQALIGGVDITVARNYFGSQISSFEMATPPPPGSGSSESNAAPYPGVFIRAPAILAAGPTVQVLGTVIATPCRQAAVTLQELERKIKAGENVVTMGVADALERKDSGGLRYKVVVVQRDNVGKRDSDDNATIHNNSPPVVLNEEDRSRVISLPGASDETNAREVICATRSGNLLCTAFHPELTEDYRWHEYFRDMVRAAKQNA